MTKEDPNGRVGLLTAMFIGAAVGGVLGFGAGAIKQISSNGWNPINWEWDKIGLSTLGGAVAGGLSAIHFGPVGSFREAITTFFFGGIGTTFGGYISGGVNNFQTAAIAFAFGGVANLAAYAFSSQLANEIGYRASGALTSKLYDVPLRDLVGTGLGGSGFSKAFISFSSHAAKLVSYAKGGWINTAACSFVNASVSNWLTSLL